MLKAYVITELHVCGIFELLEIYLNIRNSWGLGDIEILPKTNYIFVKNFT